MDTSCTEFTTPTDGSAVVFPNGDVIDPDPGLFSEAQSTQPDAFDKDQQLAFGSSDQETRYQAFKRIRSMPEQSRPRLLRYERSGMGCR